MHQFRYFGAYSLPQMPLLLSLLSRTPLQNLHAGITIVQTTLATRNLCTICIPSCRMTCNMPNCIALPACVGA